MKNRNGSGIVFAATLGFVGTLTTVASANQYGELRIHSNTTLTDDRYGDVVFDADNITLDCANHAVHISSYTKLNGGLKAAIYAYGRRGITIENCRTVGAFDHSLVIEQTTDTTVENVSAHTSALFEGNNYAMVEGLAINADYGIFIGNDNFGVYRSSIGATADAIHIDYTNGTVIADTTVSNCGGEAFSGEGNQDLTFDNVDAEGCFRGLSMYGDSNDLVEFSVFNNNGYDGIELDESTNAFFYYNTAVGNGNCDAIDDPSSSGDSWQGNSFNHVCGTVPTPH